MSQECQIGCMACKHNNFEGECAAFPDEIPFYFASGQGYHTKRMPDQDNDIVFEWIDRIEQRGRMKKIVTGRVASRNENRKAQRQVAAV